MTATYEISLDVLVGRLVEAIWRIDTISFIAAEEGDRIRRCLVCAFEIAEEHRTSAWNCEMGSEDKPTPLKVFLEQLDGLVADGYNPNSDVPEMPEDL